MARKNSALMLAVLLACSVVLAGETMLLGRVGPEEILAISPQWRQQFDTYSPAAVDLASLAETPPEATLDVYFGSWCGDSREGVPHLLRILHDAPATRLQVRYYGVDRAKKDPAGAAAAAAVERVPTFVLKVKGREVGRIVETPETTLEHDLALLIRRATGHRAP